MTTKTKYIIFLSVVTLLFILMEITAEKPVNWSFSFTADSKIPYGCYVLYQHLPDLYESGNISNSNTPLYNTLSETEYLNTNYLIINPDFNGDKLDIQKLLDFVSRGNTAFIAAHRFADFLTDTLQIATDVHFLDKDSRSINFTHPTLKMSDGYYLEKNSSSFYFDSIQNMSVEILGRDSEKNPNFIRVPFGEGSFYLNTVPLAFTNYYLLMNPASQYSFTALSYLPVRQTIWDEYYKAGRKMAGTPLRYILHREPLKWAYAVSIFSILIFIFNYSRRKQRIIPVIEPLRNTTLDFVFTIGRLYYFHRDHKNLAEQKIKYFMDEIKSTYYENTSDLNDHFFTALTEKTGQDYEYIKDLFTDLQKIRKAKKIDKTILLKLHSRIEDFRQKTRS